MLCILAVPVVILVAITLRLLQTFAPSNILIARVRASRPSFRIAVGLTALTLVLVSGAHGLGIAIENGAPGWLNLVVLVLLWDAMKFAWMAVLSAIMFAASNWRALGSGLGGWRRHFENRTESSSVRPRWDIRLRASRQSCRRGTSPRVAHAAEATTKSPEPTVMWRRSEPGGG